MIYFNKEFLKLFLQNVVELYIVYIQFVRSERATGANLAKQMDWELSAKLSPDYLP